MAIMCNYGCRGECLLGCGSGASQSKILECVDFNCNNQCGQGGGGLACEMQCESITSSVGDRARCKRQCHNWCSPQNIPSTAEIMQSDICFDFGDALVDCFDSCNEMNNNGEQCDDEFCKFSCKHECRSHCPDQGPQVNACIQHNCEHANPHIQPTQPPE